MASANRVFAITELRRTGAGQLIDTPVSFRWDAASHTAPESELAPPLRVSTVREEVPGSGEVVEQVVSVAWQPFKINGRWDDKWAGAGFAEATLDQFQKLVSRVSMVRIEFESIKLIGLLTELTPHYRRKSLIEWEVTFSPHQFGDGIASAGRIVKPTVRPTRDHVAAAQEVADSIAARHESARTIPLTDDLFAESGVDLESIQASIAAANSAADAGLEDDAIRTLLAISAQMRTVRSSSQSAQNRFVKVRSDTKVAFDDAILTLRFDSWCRNTSADARRLSVRSHEAETDMRTQAKARPRALYRPAANESLYQISTKFYGTAASWRLIYQANNLPSLYLNGTETLVIPERSA